MIADTNFLIVLANRDPGGQSKLSELEADGVSVKIPTIALLEFYVGVRRINDPE